MENINVYYDDKNYYANYQYDETSGQYARSYAGYPMRDRQTGEPIMVTNIIVQRIKMSYDQNLAVRPDMKLIGSGQADIFINGTYIQGYWQRKSASEPTEYYVSWEGEPERLLLKPGKTFIQLFPINGEVLEDPKMPGHITYTLGN